MSKFKIIIILLTVIFTLGGMVYFINKYLYSSKAAGETIGVTMTTDNNIFTVGTQKIVNVDLIPSAGKISGFSLAFIATSNLSLIGIGAPVNIGGDSTIFTQVAVSANRVTYIIDRSNELLPVSVRVPVTVMLNSPGEAKLMLDFSDDYRLSRSQVSGNISSYTFNLGPSNIKEMVFNPGVGISPTGGGSGNTTINIKLKFQGITGGLADAYKTMPVKITIKKEPDTIILATTPVSFTVDTSGVWSGTVTANLDTATNYYLLVKGPMHIQRKICVNAPTEVGAGKYSCGAGTVSLTGGTTNNLDFSTIIMMAGDLPLTETGGQDGVADAADIGYIINNLGKSDANIIAIADLNRNGGVDASDFSLEQFALSLRPDEQ